MPQPVDNHGRLVSEAAFARLTPEHRRLRARVAGLSARHPDQPERADEARRDLKAIQAERYVRGLVDSWPPLTDAQRGRLAALLAGGGEGATPVAPRCGLSARL